MDTRDARTGTRTGVADPSRSGGRRQPWFTVLAVIAVVACALAIAFAIAWLDHRDETGSLGAALVVRDQRIAALETRIDTLEDRVGATDADLARAEALAARRLEQLRELRTQPIPVLRCSASDAEVPSLPAGLPAPVRSTAEVILRAAAACDLHTLAGLPTNDGEHPFAYGLDATTPPAAYWAAEEADGEAPMRHLVELFSLPVGTRTAPDGVVEYVFPSAAAYADWKDVPTEERGPVAAWYSAEGQKVPVYDGTYWGWRVWIGADGSWRGFVTSPD